MKICINGDLVDLNKIYCITKVVSKFIRLRDIYDYVKGEYTDGVKYSIQYYFTLVSINNKDYKISILREFTLKKDLNEFSNPDYEETIEHLKFIDEMNSFRDKIVDKWGNGQIDYEQFNIEYNV